MKETGVLLNLNLSTKLSIYYLSFLQVPATISQQLQDTSNNVAYT